MILGTCSLPEHVLNESFEFCSLSAIDGVSLYMFCILFSVQDKHKVTQFSAHFLSIEHNFILWLLISDLYISPVLLSHLNKLNVISYLCITVSTSASLFQTSEFKGWQTRSRASWRPLRDSEDTGTHYLHTSVGVHLSTLKLWESWTLCFTRKCKQVMRIKSHVRVRHIFGPKYKRHKNQFKNNREKEGRIHCDL